MSDATIGCFAAFVLFGYTWDKMRRHLYAFGYIWIYMDIFASQVGSLGRPEASKEDALMGVGGAQSEQRPTRRPPIYDPI